MALVSSKMISLVEGKMASKCCSGGVASGGQGAEIKPGCQGGE